MPAATGASGPPQRISVIAWPLIAARIALMAVLLVLCLPFYYLWRLLGLSRRWPRVFLAGVGLIAGLRLTIRGEPRPGALLIANHVSWLDIPALARATGTAFVGHSGLAEIALVRHLCAMNDTVFVARHDRASVAGQVEQVRAAIAGTGALTIFPEGTTSDGAALLPFKSSLLAAAEALPRGVAVQPVLLALDTAPSVASTVASTTPETARIPQVRELPRPPLGGAICSWGLCSSSIPCLLLGPAAGAIV